MKKIFKLFVTSLLILLSVFCLASCDKTTLTPTLVPKAKEEVKVGLICLHDSSSTYDKNFIDSMYRALESLGMNEDQLVLETGVPEGEECYQKANELAQTCDLVFADSFGHEDYMIRAAQDNPGVYFCHATGTKAHTQELSNYFNAFASIYEGRYLAGIAAGMKLNEMIANNEITAAEALIGYVGAFPYAEVVSGYTSFFLGARSVCASVTMKVRYTSSWYDFDKEKTAAESLIKNDKCVLISQHADSYGAPEACESNDVPNVTYNGTTVLKCPNTYVISSRINWAPYYEKMINAIISGEAVLEKDYTGTLSSLSVKLDPVGTCAAEGTQAAIDAAILALENKTLHVFDTSKFTVNGQAVTSYLADVDDMGDYIGETEVISDGYFHESAYRSAPYFDLRIDGITEINKN